MQDEMRGRSWFGWCCPAYFYNSDASFFFKRTKIIRRFYARQAKKRKQADDRKVVNTNKRLIFSIKFLALILKNGDLLKSSTATSIQMSLLSGNFLSVKLELLFDYGRFVAFRVLLDGILARIIGHYFLI